MSRKAQGIETPWIVFEGGAGVLCCLRCGERQAVLVPIAVSRLAVNTKNFIRRHRSCPDSPP